ncbi:MAG: hypothetical protein AAF236_05000 [Verrucomicrobiota bacterium]
MSRSAPSNPLKTLALLLVVGAAFAGWLYGIHWKRVASGGKFNATERLVVQLRDQVEILTLENAKLITRLKELDPELAEVEESAPNTSSANQAIPVPEN